MKPHWTKNKASLLEVIKDDEAPISLIALELRSITLTMTKEESIRLAILLISLAVGSVIKIKIIKKEIQLNAKYMGRNRKIIKQRIN